MARIPDPFAFDPDRHDYYGAQDCDPRAPVIRPLPTDEELQAMDAAYERELVARHAAMQPARSIERVERAAALATGKAV